MSLNSSTEDNWINETRQSSFSVSLLPSHSLLAMVFPSWPMEQIDDSLSTLVKLALRPPSSTPPPSVLVSEDGCEAGPPGVWSPSRNTFVWPWMLSARECEKRREREKTRTNGEGRGMEMLWLHNNWLSSVFQSMLLFCLIRASCCALTLCFKTKDKH